MATFWEEKMDCASMRIGVITEQDAPKTEHEVKEHIAYALKHGSCVEAAEVIAEAAEWQTAHLMQMAANPNAR